MLRMNKMDIYKGALDMSKNREVDIMVAVSNTMSKAVRVESVAMKRRWQWLRILS